MHNSVNWVLKFKKGTVLVVCHYQGIPNYQMYAGDRGFCYGGQNIFIDHLLLKSFRDVNHVNCP